MVYTLLKRKRMDYPKRKMIFIDPNAAAGDSFLAVNILTQSLQTTDTARELSSIFTDSDRRWRFFVGWSFKDNRFGAPHLHDARDYFEATSQKGDAIS